MSAYAIFIRESVRDPALLEDYAGMAGAARGDHPMRPLAAYGDLVSLEGDNAEGVLIAEFPTMDAARAWYFSAAYQAAKEVRNEAADYRVLLVAGL